MPQPYGPTSEQKSEFDRRGVIRLDGLLPLQAVQAARETVLQRLSPSGLWHDGAWHLDARPRPEWPEPGLTVKDLGNKHPEIAALFDAAPVKAILRDLFDDRPYDQSLFRVPQLLINLPNANRWFVPSTGWHVDMPRLASGDRPGVSLFTFLDVVDSGGGGTLAIAGSHRLLGHKGFLRSKEISALLREMPFFRDVLFAKDPIGAADRRELLQATADVDGIGLGVVEMTGAPGDVWLMDLRALHNGSPNASTRPRMMATHRFMPNDLVAETEQGFGWHVDTAQLA